MTNFDLFRPEVIQWFEDNQEKFINENYTAKQVTEECAKFVETLPLCESYEIVTTNTDMLEESRRDELRRARAEHRQNQAEDDDETATNAEEDEENEEGTEGEEGNDGDEESGVSHNGVRRRNREQRERNSATNDIVNGFARRLVVNKKDADNNIYDVVDAYLEVAEEKHMLDKKWLPLSSLDTHKIHDMTALLAFTNIPNVNLSNWDTSRVKSMEGMFYKSTFNNDSILGWNVRTCENFKNMFVGSDFNQDIEHNWVPGLVASNRRDEHGNPVMVPAKLPQIGLFSAERREANNRRINQSIDWDAYERANINTEVENEEEEQVQEESRNNKNIKNMNHKHILTREQFIAEGKLADFGKKVVGKVKSALKAFAAKVSEYVVSFIGSDGEILPATSPLTAMNYVSEGNVEGVKVYGLGNFSQEVKDGLLSTQPTSVIPVPEDDEYYPEEVSDLEKRNWEYFKTHASDELKEAWGLIPAKDNKINEERVGLDQQSGGLNLGKYGNIGPNDLRRWIKKCLADPQGSSILIWGAPGIGKSTIPKHIIKELNEGKKTEEKKTVMVVDCGQMKSDGFVIPLPETIKMEHLMQVNPNIAKKAQEIGADLDKLSAIGWSQSIDAPKTWLPMYKYTGDKNTNEILNMIANGGTMAIRNEKDDVIGFEETGDGGIIMLDEMFRADEDIFKILMNICEAREMTGGYRLGDKWAVIACSNRPYDDDEVKTNFKVGAPALLTRFGQFNFVPDFNEWKVWAKKHGFDDLTLEFLVSEKDPRSGEYINWHNIDYEKKKSDNTSEFPTPRTWAKAMRVILDDMKEFECGTLADLEAKHHSEFMQDVSAFIGPETAEKYAEFIETHSDGIIVEKIFTDAHYTLPQGVEVSCMEIMDRIVTYIKSKYSFNTLPDPKDMIRMVNFLAKNYTMADSNVVIERTKEIDEYLRVQEWDDETFDKFDKYYQVLEDKFPE